MSAAAVFFTTFCVGAVVFLPVSYYFGKACAKACVWYGDRKYDKEKSTNEETLLDHRVSSGEGPFLGVSQRALS